jgi:hypothetical protein
MHPYTGELVSGPENIIIMCSENHNAEVLQPQMDAYGADLERIFTLSYVLSVKDVGTWNRVLCDYRPALVVVDPIQEALAGCKMNDSADTRAALLPLLKLTEEHRTTVLLLGHLGKQSAELKLQHRAIGSVNVGAMMRSELVIETVAGDTTGKRVIIHTKPSISAKGEDVYCRIVPHEVEPDWTVGLAVWEADTPASYATKKEQAGALARAYVKARGGECDSSELETHLKAEGHSHGTIAEALKRVGIKRENGRATLSPR